MPRRRATDAEQDGQRPVRRIRTLFPSGWREHDSRFERAEERRVLGSMT